MVFNNNHTDKSLEEAHAENSFYDPYIGRDAGYLQVTRYNGRGPALLVVPQGDTPFEAYNPLLDDRTPRGITFEGFYEWMVHSKAHAAKEWSEAEPWNPPTSEVIDHPEFGWLAFGGSLAEEGKWVQIIPEELARSGVYIASLGLWLTLDAGKFKSINLNRATNEVQLMLEGNKYTPHARLRIGQPARLEGIGSFEPETSFAIEREAYLIPLNREEVEVKLVD